ncbi:hypothetical protein ACPYO6_01330 [Georgenia sp. Z1344]|uniref:hypothetical protein n=1 Tax=Georgenia sp. Z1344 TaxID=3416706 RepID=UPI003CFB4D48
MRSGITRAIIAIAILSLVPFAVPHHAFANPCAGVGAGSSSNARVDVGNTEVGSNITGTGTCTDIDPNANPLIDDHRPAPTPTGTRADNPILGIDAGANTGTWRALIHGPRLDCTSEYRRQGAAEIILDDNLFCNRGRPQPTTPTATPATPGAPPPPVQAAAPVVITVSYQEAVDLLVEPGEAMMDGRWQLAQMPVLLWTTAREHIATTEILGTQVFVRFTPTEHTWDPNDGTEPFTTTGPGAPYPNHTISHPYTQGYDAIHVTLTTEWTAEFLVQGETDWQPIPGTIPITTRTDPFEVRTREVRLVPECAIHNHC